MKIIPLGDRILLKKIKASDTTKGGILLTSNSKENSQEAIVIAVGNNGIIVNTNPEIILKAGDHVMYPRYGAMQIEFEGEEYLIMKQSDIMAIIKDE